MILKKRNHDIKLFIKACYLVKEKKHITIEGQMELAFLASQLSSKLDLENKKLLPDTNNLLSTSRLVGLIDAEGCFSVYLLKYKLGSNKIIFQFNITQENSEIKFLNNLIEFFGCGKIYTNNKGRGYFYINDKKNLINKIIPFFELNELQTIKKNYFLRFKKVLEICTKNKTLLPVQIEEIREILKNEKGKRPKK
jgi:hypothetical protein